MKKPKNMVSWIVMILFIVFSFLIISSLLYGVFISPPPENVGYYFTKSSDFDPNILSLEAKKKLQEQQDLSGLTCIFLFLAFFGVALWGVLFDEDETTDPEILK